MNCLARGPAHSKSSEAEPLLLFSPFLGSPWSASWEHILGRTEPGLGSALATALGWEWWGHISWTSTKLVQQCSSPPPTASLPLPCFPDSSLAWLFPCCRTCSPPGLLLLCSHQNAHLFLLSFRLALDPPLPLLTEATLLVPPLHLLAQLLFYSPPPHHCCLSGPAPCWPWDRKLREEA